MLSDSFRFRSSAARAACRLRDALLRDSAAEAPARRPGARGHGMLPGIAGLPLPEGAEAAASAAAMIDFDSDLSWWWSPSSPNFLFEPPESEGCDLTLDSVSGATDSLLDGGA